ncbi:MAG: hypothetical protein JW731_09885 [Bacteroidales bacterium]|nr:hypothetical protein [Bacteroidales bacterium]
MKYPGKIWVLLVFISLIAGPPTLSQVKVQVVTQKISKTFDWNKGMSLQMNAEHAEIICTTHPSNTIILELTITSKHENKNTAEGDLKKMKWLAEMKGDKFYLRNYVELARGETRPESALKVTYNLKVPEDCPLDIRNYFGSIDIKNVKAGLKINSEFSKISLGKVGGNVNIQTLFGDIDCTQVDGETAIISNRSDISMAEMSGNIDIDASVAEINLGSFGKVKQLKIKAEKSVIDLKMPQFDQFAFSLDLSDCEFKKPENMMVDISLSDPSNIKAKFQVNSNKPLVTINLNFGSLAINP